MTTHFLASSQPIEPCAVPWAAKHDTRPWWSW